MMYTKLALKNIKKSAKDYMIYFFTLFLVACFIYAFLSLAVSNEIIYIAQNFKLLTTGIIFLTVIVGLICIFIVTHAMSIILSRRKKEFAIYQLLGMSKKNITKLYLVENIIMSFISLCLGIIIGGFVSGVFVKIIYSVFEKNMEFEVKYIPLAVIFTASFYCIICIIGLLKAINVIWKDKIINLLYDNRKNEKKNSKIDSILKIKVSIGLLLILLGFVSLIISISLTSNIGFAFLAIGILFVFTGIYYLYSGIPFIIQKITQKNKKWYYKNTNLFLAARWNRQLITSGKVMAIVSVLLTASLSFLLVGLVMGIGYKVNIKSDYPYDVSVAVDMKVENFDAVIEYVENQYPIKETVFFYLYHYDNLEIDIISISDYNRLRALLSLETISINSNEYLIHCDTPKFIKNIKDDISNNNKIDINGLVLYGNENNIATEPMESYRFAGTYGYLMIVPDEIATTLNTNKSRLAVSLQDKPTSEFYHDLSQYIRGEWNPTILNPTNDRITMSVSVKEWGIANSLSGFISIAFCGLYLCITFIIFSSTLISFEQLFSIDNAKTEYLIVNKLGVSKKDQKKLALSESINRFFVPLLIPIPITIIISFTLDSLFADFILLDNVIFTCLFITLGVFSFIYGMYFICTYYIYTKNISIQK